MRNSTRPVSKCQRVAIPNLGRLDVGVIALLGRFVEAITGCHIFKVTTVIDIIDCIRQYNLFDSLYDVALVVNHKLIFQEIISKTTIVINSCVNFKRISILVLLHKTILI